MFITINAKNYLYHFMLTTSHRKFDQVMIQNQYLQVGSESTSEPNECESIITQQTQVLTTQMHTRISLKSLIVGVLRSSLKMWRFTAGLGLKSSFVTFWCSRNSEIKKDRYKI